MSRSFKSLINGGAVKNRSRGKPAHAVFCYHGFASVPCQGDLLLHLTVCFVVISALLREAYRGERGGIPEVCIIFSNFSLCETLTAFPFGRACPRMLEVSYHDINLPEWHLSAIYGPCG